MRRVVPADPSRAIFQPSSGTDFLLPLPTCTNINCRRNIQSTTLPKYESFQNHHSKCGKVLNRVDGAQVSDNSSDMYTAVELHVDNTRNTTADISCNNDSLSPSRSRRNIQDGVSFEKVTENLLNASTPSDGNIMVRQDSYGGYGSDDPYDEHYQSKFNPKNKAYNQELAHLAYKKIEKRLIETIAAEVSRQKPKHYNETPRNNELTVQAIKMPSNIDNATGSVGPKINVIRPTININVGSLFPSIQFAKRAKKRMNVSTNRRAGDGPRSLSRISEASRESSCECGVVDGRRLPISHPVYAKSITKVGVACHNLSISVIQNNKFCNQSLYGDQDECDCNKSTLVKSADVENPGRLGVGASRANPSDYPPSYTLGSRAVDGKIIPANVLWKKLTLIDTICQHFRSMQNSPGRNESIS